MNSTARTFLITVFVLLLAVLMVGRAQAQDAPKVCVSQEAANKCVAAAAELIEARNVIAEFQKERAASIAEREAANTVIKGLNDLIAVKDRISAEKDKAFELLQKIVTIQQTMIDDLVARLNKPKSGFQRFMDALKTVGYILAGVTLGRGL